MKKASQPIIGENYCCANCGDDFRKGQEIFTMIHEEGLATMPIKKSIISFCSFDCRQQYMKNAIMKEMEITCDNIKKLKNVLKDNIQCMIHFPNDIIFIKLQLKILNTILLIIQSIKMKNVSYYRFKSLLQEYYEELIALSPTDLCRLNMSRDSMCYLSEIESYEALFTMS